MATSDIAISQLNEQLIITEDTLFVSVDDSLVTKKVTFNTMKDKILQEALAERPLAEMSLTALSPAQTFSDSNYSIVTAFDKIQYERGLDIDLDNDSVEVLTVGDYRISAFVNAEFGNGDALELAIMLNGVATEPFGPIQGRGTGKGVSIRNADIDPFAIGDIIQLGAKNGDTGDIDVVFLKVRIIVERV